MTMSFFEVLLSYLVFYCCFTVVVVFAPSAPSALPYFCSYPPSPSPSAPSATAPTLLLLLVHLVKWSVTTKSNLFHLKKMGEGQQGLFNSSCSPCCCLLLNPF